jgi:hypothetical protein
MVSQVVAFEGDFSVMDDDEPAGAGPLDPLGQIMVSSLVRIKFRETLAFIRNPVNRSASRDRSVIKNPGHAPKVIDNATRLEKVEHKLKPDQIFFKKLGYPQQNEQEYPKSKTDSMPDGRIESGQGFSLPGLQNDIDFQKNNFIALSAIPGR